MQCDDDYNDAYKYVNDINQLRDTVIGYGKLYCMVFVDLTKKGIHFEFLFM